MEKRLGAKLSGKFAEERDARAGMKKRYRVGILGATGAVGQKFMQLLAEHPWFEISAVAASERSAGKPYAEAVRWKLPAPIPARLRELEVRNLTPDLDCDFVFSALDSSVAGSAEEAFARAGYPVISNSKNHRMDDDVPLLVPEANPEHCELISIQKQRRGFDRGFIVTNPNCAVVGLVMVLKPLQDAFGVEAVSVTTLQAISGAGYPGVPAADIVENVIPYIEDEEEKIETEPRKILGTLEGSAVRPAGVTISAQCHRVPVVDGHLEAVSVRLRTKASPAEVSEALRSFSAEPQRLGLPSAPARPILVREERDRPQPRFDRDTAEGMAVVVGRIRSCPVLDIRLTLLSHNLVRGAAGAAVLNAELLAQKRFL